VKIRACALVIAMLVAGCGGGGESKPRPISGAAKQVAAVIVRLQRATARKDFTTICDHLLAAATRRQAGGAECPAVLGARARGVSRPRIVIKAIQLQDDNARVTVRTTAGGQAPATDVIRLVREKGEYRVLSLGR
jgi:hypothetical protein